MSQPGDKKVDSGNDLVNLKVSYEHTIKRQINQ